VKADSTTESCFS